jgi:hypothetical protein
MRILKQVPDSVLWMVADSEATRANLVREAEARGVDGARLLFAGRVPPADYLARFRLADLFLDTNPFNAGTTASDALWAGLQVLTWAGQTFCSRMAGSLLHAVGLPELVTHTLEDYEAQAIALGNDRPRMDALRARLASNRDTSPLFDTPRFVRDYEDLLASVVRRPAGVDLVDEAPARAQSVPEPATLAVPQQGMLALMRPGMHSVVEVGGDTLAQAWRARTPRSHFTVIVPDAQAAQAAASGWSSTVIAHDPEQLDAHAWQQVAPAQCWLFPDTLERLRDPWTFLQRLRREALGPVELVACVGNAQHWQAQARLAAGGAGADDWRALHRFDRAALALMLRECGFAIAAMTAVTTQPPPDAALDAIRTLARAGGGDPELAVQDALAAQYLVRAIAA